MITLKDHVISSCPHMMPSAKLFEITCVTWLIRMCDMTHPQVWHGSFTWATGLVHTCDMTHSHVRHDHSAADVCDTASPPHPHMMPIAIFPRDSHAWLHSFTCDSFTWGSHIPHSHGRHDLFTRVWHDSFTCVTWLIHMCEMTHSHVRHNSFTCMTWPIRCAAGVWHHVPPPSYDANTGVFCRVCRQTRGQISLPIPPPRSLIPAVFFLFFFLTRNPQT